MKFDLNIFRSPPALAMLSSDSEEQLRLEPRIRLADLKWMSLDLSAALIGSG